MEPCTPPMSPRSPPSLLEEISMTPPVSPRKLKNNQEPAQFFDPASPENEPETVQSQMLHPNNQVNSSYPIIGPMYPINHPNLVMPLLQSPQPSEPLSRQTSSSGYLSTVATNNQNDLHKVCKRQMNVKVIDKLNDKLKNFASNSDVFIWQQTNQSMSIPITKTTKLSAILQDASYYIKEHDKLRETISNLTLQND